MQVDRPDNGSSQGQESSENTEQSESDVIGTSDETGDASGEGQRVRETELETSILEQTKEPVKISFVPNKEVDKNKVLTAEEVSEIFNLESAEEGVEMSALDVQKQIRRKHTVYKKLMRECL